MSNVEFTFDHFWKIDIFVCTAIFKIASEGCSKSKSCDHKVSRSRNSFQSAIESREHEYPLDHFSSCLCARCNEAQLADLAAWSGGLLLLGILCYDKGVNVV